MTKLPDVRKARQVLCFSLNLAIVDHTSINTQTSASTEGEGRDRDRRYTNEEVARNNIKTRTRSKQNSAGDYREQAFAVQYPG